MPGPMKDWTWWVLMAIVAGLIIVVVVNRNDSPGCVTEDRGDGRLVEVCDPPEP